MKLKTINVIESVDDRILNVTAFTENDVGNMEAVKLFKKLIREHNKLDGPTYSDEDIERMIKHGIYDDLCGYNLYFIKSRG